MTTTTELSRDAAPADSGSLYDMADLFPKHTSLPFVVWISTWGGAPHDVRVKVSATPKAVPSEMISVALRPDIRVVAGKLDGDDLKLLAQWIELNRSVILQYWEGEIDTKDALDGIRSLA